MATIQNNLQQVRTRMRLACAAAQRPLNRVNLLCVSKTYGPQAVREAFNAGERCFGENYVQEGLDKITALADVRDSLEWHLIGPLQSNKTRAVAEHFDWVHSIDSLKLAGRLSAQRPPSLRPLNVCLQINTSNEASKSGVAPANTAALAQAVNALPHLRLRGLMAIPEATADVGEQRQAHRRLRELLLSLNMPELDTLSMGMSQDLEAAIAEGATWVRVGSAIFGERR
ncbi:MAG: YggS family pyridoxal phosphate-dependent enzyme [Rhizobacter sp.]